MEKRIEGFENYLISDNGLVINVNTGRMLKPEIDKDGYFRVSLSKDGKKYKRFVHRLVAIAFIDNENGLPYVNHKDENKQNNNVSNLEWCTPQYNTEYSLGKAVRQYDENGQLCGEYKSGRAAERACGIGHDAISRCCNGKQKKAGGYYWKYVKGSN